MKVKCTGAHEGLDGAPTILSVHEVPIDSGCGVTFDASPDPWDAKTNAAGDVLSEHAGVACPKCGTVTFVVKARR